MTNKIESKWHVGTKVICGFPGVGKTSYLKCDYMPSEFAIDSDSSKFDKDFFPYNYIKHIQESIKTYSRIMVSSHKDVREALILNKIPFTLVYPHPSLKLEYIERYINRGSTQPFIDLIFNNWDEWLNECWNQKGCDHIVLRSGQYLSNVI